MSQLDDDIAAEGLGDWLAEAGEAVTYVPRSGASRPIVGIVDRGPPERSGPNGQVTHKVEITVENSVTTGIASTELDTGGDHISFPMEVGSAPQSRPIVDRVFDAGGMLILAIG